jgi:hypothetical protein
VRHHDAADRRRIARRIKITGNRSLVRTAARRRVVARVVGDVASKSTRGDFFAAVVRRRRRAAAPPSASRDDAPQSLEAFEREMRRLREENPDGLLDDSEDRVLLGGGPRVSRRA